MKAEDDGARKGEQVQSYWTERILKIQRWLRSGNQIIWEEYLIHIQIIQIINSISKGNLRHHMLGLFIRRLAFIERKG